MMSQVFNSKTRIIEVELDKPLSCFWPINVFLCVLNIDFSTDTLHL